MTTLVILAAISSLISIFKKNYIEGGITAGIVVLGLLATLPTGWGWTILFVFLFASSATGALEVTSPCGLISLAVAVILFPIRWEWDGFVTLISLAFGGWAIVVSFLKD